MRIIEGDALMMTHSRGVIDESLHAQLVSKRESPGLMVMTSPTSLLYMNHRAQQILSQLVEHAGDSQAEHSGKAKGLLPPTLLAICAETFKQMRHRSEIKDWERFELRHMIGLPREPVLVRSIGIPDASRQLHALIIVVLEQIGRRKAEVDANLAEKFRFTEREQEIIQCLSKGWTNKEIACALGNATTTVREHIRNIMVKTNTTTRAGILGQVLQSK